MATSVVTELLGGAVHLGTSALGAAVGQARVVAVDAATDDDLDALADAIAALGPRVVPVGSAGLARALAARWSPAGGRRPMAVTPATVGGGPVVVLVSSQHAVAREQERLLRSRRGGSVRHLAPTTGQLLGDASWVPADVGDGLVVLTARTDRADDAGVVAAALADVVARLHEAAPLGAVVAVGGDGAHALTVRWGVTSIAVCGAAAEGVPHGVLVGGDVDGLPIVTKAGGFGPPETLLDVVRHLREGVAP